MNDFMKGRNGADELTVVLGFAGIIIAMIGSMARIQWLSWIAIAVIVLGVLRGLSKNIDARRKENDAFVTATANVPGLGKLGHLRYAVVLRPFHIFLAVRWARSKSSLLVASLGGGTAAASTSRAAGTSKEDFERAKRTAKKMWKGRKTTAYLKCPNCGQMLSVPKGKGKIRVTCPKCHAKMETRS